MFSLWLVFFFCSPVAFLLSVVLLQGKKSYICYIGYIYLFLCVCRLRGRGNLKHILLATRTVTSVFVQQEASAMSHLPQWHQTFRSTQHTGLCVCNLVTNNGAPVLVRCPRLSLQKMLRDTQHAMLGANDDTHLRANVWISRIILLSYCDNFTSWGSFFFLVYWQNHSAQ